MSANATITVSIAPVAMSARSSSTVSCGGAVMRVSWCLERSSSDESPQQRGGGVAVLLHRLPGPGAVAVEDGPDDGVVLVVGVRDVGGQHRDRGEELVEGRLRPGDG